MNELITVFKVMAEFNGSNHVELARKYNLPSNTVYRIISHAARVAIVQGLSEGEEKSIALLWAGRASQLGSLQGSLAVLKAAEKAINSDSHHHAHFALVALHSNGQATAQGSSSAAPSTDQAESQPDTQGHKSDLPASAALQTTLLDLPTNTSMSPFTVFLGRLVEHLGAEIAINLVREFAGKTIQFPITQDYTGSTKKTQVAEVLKQATRTNGKQVIARAEAERIARSLTTGRASSALPTAQATLAQQKERPLSQQDQISQPHLSSDQPRLPPVSDCLECTRLKDQAEQQTNHSPTHPSGLLWLLTLRFRRARSG